MAEELSSQAMLDEVSKDHQAETKQEPSITDPKSVEGQTPAATPQLFKYVTRGGKEVEEPLEMVLKRAGYGYNYAQDMHNLNQQMERIKGIEERNKALSRWEEYDKYAQENQEWATHVQQAWENRANLNQQADPSTEKFKALETQLAELKAFRDETLSERQKQQYAMQDKTFGDEIQTVGKTYQVDLSEADEQGRSIEWRVLDHMAKIGLDGSKQGHFTAAFKDYYFENLLERQKSQVMEGQVKSKTELKRAGILDISRSPRSDTSKGYRPGMDWNALGDMALADLRANR